MDTISKEGAVGIKESKGKTRWSLLPFEALEPVVAVLNFGATTKYLQDNWKKVECKAPYVDAIIRHWKKYINDGEEFDKESGESHLAHLCCDVLFLLWDRMDKKDVDFDTYIEKLLTYPDYVQELDVHKFD
jgi:hypothetical protein